MKTYSVIKEYVRENVDKLKLVFPDKSEKELKEFVLDKVAEKLVNKDALLDNNYVGKTARSTMMDLLQYIHDSKPIIAGYGVLFKNQHQADNPAAQMLNAFGVDRKALKKELKKYSPDDYEYGKLDRAQKRKKVNMNSYYGASGNENSVFYNIYTAAATTATGQALISSAETGFEMFMGNDVKWYDVDECLLFISRTINEDYEIDLKTEEISDEMVYGKLIKTFFNPSSDDIMIVKQVISNLSYKDKLKVYYKNNIYEFIKIPKIHKLLKKIVCSVESFKDPYNIPKVIQGDLDLLWEYCSKYVLYNYPVYNRINRLKFETRNNIVTIDTDSNMATVSKWKTILLNTVFDDSALAKSEMDRGFIAVNVFASILTKVINENVLAKYCEVANIPKDFAGLLNLKNEFYYTRMILTATKKRYVGSIRLREGAELYPEKIDLKGLDFAKSTASEFTKSFFNNLIKEDILYSKEIDTSLILKKISDFKEYIIQSLQNGEKTFLTPTSVKEIEAYKTPYEIQGVIGTLAWNELYPGMAISLPDKVYIIKMLLNKSKHLNDLEYKHPEIYKIVEDSILNSPNKTIAKRKLDVLAIPQNLDRIPEWCIPYINIDDIVNDNLTKFYPILESLGINLLQTKANVLYYSNIISF